MTETLTCPNGHPVSVQDVSCPSCATVLQLEPLPLPTAGSAASIPGYEILGELGRGAMGIVFKARQLNLKRLVAVKMILGGAFADANLLERFHNEANIIAQLQHPNIVQIHEVGEHHGQPYLSLEFVEGVTLAQFMHGVPQPPCAAAQLVEILARALHAVHEAGVVHRDLKPGNVMLQHADSAALVGTVKDESGVIIKRPVVNLQDAVPKVMDFGLAKQFGGSKHLTASGAVLGTPSYMAPEQAIGKASDIGPAADVYALGAILYEALTGRPPHLGESAVHTLQQVLHENVVPPRHLQPKVPADLDTICLKCLQREPERRFPSALALAEDLRRYLEGKPIVTRPVSYPERFWRWCRRNPWDAGLAAAVALALLAGTVVSLYFALQTLEREKQLNQQLYIAQMKRIQEAWEDGQMARFEELLKGQKPELRDFEWYYWKNLSDQRVRLAFPTTNAAPDLAGVAISADGSQVAAVSRDGLVQGWDTLTQQTSFAAQDFDTSPGRMLFTPDGSYLVGISDKDLALLVLDTRKNTVVRKLKDVSHLMVSSRGKFLACAMRDRNVTLLDLANLQELRSFGPHDGNIAGLAFSKDDALIAVADYQLADRQSLRKLSNIKIWNTNTGAQVKVLEGDLDTTLYMGFSADGQNLVSVVRDQVIRHWDVKSGKETRPSLKGPGGGRIKFLDFSPDGSRLAYTSGEETVQLFDFATLEQLKPLMGHAVEVSRAVFSPDSKLLVTASEDRTVKVWEAATSRLLRVFRGHTAPVNAVAFGPSNQLASAASDGLVQLWHADQDQGSTRPAAGVNGVTVLGFFPSSQLLAYGQDDGGLRYVPGPQALEPQVLKGHAARVTSLAFSGDGTHFASADRDKTLLVWDRNHDVPMLQLKGIVGDIACVTFSGDGKHLAVADKTAKLATAPVSTVSVWDLATGKIVQTFADKSSAAVVELTFVPDGQRLLGVTETGGVEAWDMATGKFGRVLAGQTQEPVTAAAFGPDGHSVAMAVGQTVEVRDLATGFIDRLKGYDSPVRCLAYNPAGNRLVSAYKDGAVKVWHVALGQEVLTLRGHQGSVARVTFSGDGQVLAAGGAEIKLWDGKHPKPNK